LAVALDAEPGRPRDRARDRREPLRGLLIRMRSLLFLWIRESFEEVSCP
jgi:hypothetical protein